MQHNVSMGLVMYTWRLSVGAKHCTHAMPMSGTQPTAPTQVDIPCSQRTDGKTGDLKNGIMLDRLYTWALAQDCSHMSNEAQDSRQLGDTPRHDPYCKKADATLHKHS